MGRTVDNRVVAMSFESGKFEAGVNRTMGLLDKLKSSLNFTSAGKGLDGIQAAANKTDLSHVGSSIAGVSNGFSALSVVGISALATITSAAVSAGLSLVNSLTLAPVMGGFREYETGLNSVQTILANTQAQGTTIKDVGGALDELNHYADQTIYNFGEMTRNIGTFTAAGVDLKTATASIKGIANLAALSGSNAEQASRAMYQLSQAIAAGKVSLMDWKSVENAGMGGAVFQKALWDTAKAMGRLKDVPMGQTFEEWKKAGNSFRNSISADARKAADSAKVMGKAHKDAAEMVKRAQESSAESVLNAKKRVQEAQKGLTATTKQAARDVKAAVKEQNAAIADSENEVYEAFLKMEAAKKHLTEAMKPASADDLGAAQDRLTTAGLDQADTADAVTLAQQEQKRAAEDLTAAEENLTAVKADRKSTAEDILSAERGVEDATKRVTDAADAQARALIAQRNANRDVNAARADLTKTQQKGTEADQEVKDAQDDLTKSVEAHAAAVKKVSDDKIAEAKRVRQVIKAGDQEEKESGQALVEAKKAQAKVIKETQEAIAAAHESATERITAAQESLAAAAEPKESWLSSEVLTSTLEQLTGDMTDAELKAKGFTDAQIKAIQAQAKVAKDAATKVKTLTGVFGTAKELMGSGWAETFKIVFGDFEEARTLFTSVSSGFSGFLGGFAKGRNEMLKTWKELGGRDILIRGLQTALTALVSVIKPVTEAFRDIFPAKSGQDLVDATVKFRWFMQSLVIGDDTAKNLKRTFRGLFAIFSIAGQVIGGVLGVFKDLFNAATSGSGGILSFTGNIGDWLVKVDKALKKGDGLKKFFEVLGTVLAVPVRLLSVITGAITGLFDGWDDKDSKDINKSLGSMSDHLSPLKKLISGVTKSWGGFLTVLEAIKEKLQPAIDAIKDTFNGLGDTLAGSIESGSFDGVLEVIKTGLLGGIFLMIRNFFKGGLSQAFGSGLLGNIGESFDALTGSLKAMQSNIQADTLKKIAIAVALLTASIVALSFVNADDMKRSLAAMTIAFGQLLGAMAILVKISGSAGFIKLPIIAGSLILLAGAIDLLVLAVVAMSRLTWGELAKGLAGVAGLLVAISAAAGPLAKNSAGMISAGLGIAAIAVGMKILASAIKDFGGMDWGVIGKGLAGITGALVGIGVAARLFPPGMVGIGLGLVGVAVGLKILAGAVQTFGTMDWKVIAQGIGAIAVALVAIGLAMQLMPKSMPIMAVGLILVSAALMGISGVIATLGNMDIKTVVQGVVAMAAALGVLAVGLYAMSGTLLGSAALVVASGALMMLVPSIKLLGNMSWGQIVKGMVALAATFAVLGVAGALLTPVIPGLLGLGLALLAIGAGIALAGVGLGLIAAGISALVVAGPAGIKIMVSALLAFAEAIPEFVKSFVKGLLEMVMEIAKKAPAFVKALGKILVSLAEAVIVAAPKIGEAFIVIIKTALKVLRELFPDIVKTGFDMLMTLLQGIYDNIDNVTEMVVKIVAKFIETLLGLLWKVVEAGGKIIGHLISGIAEHLPDVGTKAKEIISKVLGAISAGFDSIKEHGREIIRRVVSGISAMIAFTGKDGLADKLGGIADAVIEAIKGSFDSIKEHGREIIRHVVSGISAMIAFADPGGLIDTLKGIYAAVKDAITGAGKNLIELGKNIIKGIIAGIKKVKLGDALKGIVKGALGKLKDAIDSHSPSRLFAAEIGEPIGQGIALGITNTGDAVSQAATNMVDDVVDTLVSTLSVVPDILDGIMDLDPVITPVIDLTNIEAGAKQIGSLTEVPPIDATASFNQAAAINAAQQATSANAALAPQVPSEIKFEQNNYSPEALTPVEVYRLTKNQLALAKIALGVA